MNVPPEGGTVDSDGAEPQVDASAKPTTELVEALQPLFRPEKAKEGTRLVATMIEQYHSGPLPPARELAGYERALPGGADRVVSMAEREQAHRHEIEKIMFRTEAGLKTKGQIFALAALICSLVVVFLVAHDGHAVEAAAIGVGVIVGVVALFLGNKFVPAMTGRGKAGDQSDENESGSETPKKLPNGAD